MVCEVPISACTVGHAATFAVNAALTASQRQPARESFPCTYPSTPSVRLDKPQATFLKQMKTMVTTE